jgi:putative membrane protein
VSVPLLELWDGWGAVPAVLFVGLGLWVLVARGGARLRLRAALPALCLVGVAMASPLAVLARGTLFSAHTLQHLFLLLGVPPLALKGIAREPSGTSAPRRSAYPAWVGWGAGVGGMWMWHLPALCTAASERPWVYQLQALSLLTLGGLFWWPILASREEQRMAPLEAVVYLSAACVACTALGAWLTFSPVQVCPAYAHPATAEVSLVRNWGLSPERDQQLGGLLMWVPACAVYAGMILALLARWYRGPLKLSGVGSAP